METTDIIINNIYNNPSFPFLKINPNIFCKLLLIHTSKVPFYNHNGEIYTQIDGISVGSGLGPTFSNFCMSNLENKIFSDIKNYIFMYAVMISLFLQIILKKLKNY